jgi:DNA-binding MarR family transcriptional regulator
VCVSMASPLVAARLVSRAPGSWWCKHRDRRGADSAEQADLRTTGVSSPELPPATTKRAQLIGLLERPEGATVAEIGQRLGWLPHTVRAAITGLRKAGREVTRSKDADDRSVYRLVSIETASKR